MMRPLKLGAVNLKMSGTRVCSACFAILAQLVLVEPHFVATGHVGWISAPVFCQRHQKRAQTPFTVAARLAFAGDAVKAQGARASFPQSHCLRMQSENPPSELEHPGYVPQRLREKAEWIGESTDPKHAGLRLVELGDDWARNHGEEIPLNIASESVKVPGCVSVVRIAVELSKDVSTGDGRTVTLHGQSDARVARGMMAIILNGLSGEKASTVLEISAATITELAKLKSILPPGRNDAISNILRCIQAEVRKQLDADKTQPSEENKAQIISSEAHARRIDEGVWAYGGSGEEVAVLLSGGVDSSVALELVRRQGFRPRAFYLKIWLEDELAHLGECPWEEDWGYASAVAEQLSVPLEAVSLQREYWDQVVQYLIAEAGAGRTPNPDIMCNSRIKFGMFMDIVGRHFGKVATGHYARVEPVAEGGGRVELKTSPDLVKDQTYFLCGLSQQQLQKAMFPIGPYPKHEVRQLAAEFTLPTQKRKDSQGICFLGKLRFEDFVGHHLGTNPGPVLDYHSGREIGEHNGLWYHTIGQRKGLGQATRAFTHEGPWYVAGKETSTNTLLVSSQYDLIDTPRREFDVDSIRWIAGRPPPSLSVGGGPSPVLVKVRHGPNVHEASLQLRGTGNQGHVGLSRRDSGLAPGQWAAFYQGDVCLGGGVISESSSMSPVRDDGVRRELGERQREDRSEEAMSVGFLQDGPQLPGVERM